MSSHSGWNNHSSASEAASDGFQSNTREAVDPFIHNDLQLHETCDSDRLLEVFLTNCRQDVSNAIKAAPRTPNPSQHPDTTEERTVPTNISPDPVAISTAPELSDIELLDACLNAVLPICSNNDFQDLIAKYCVAPKNERSGYPPFTKMANFALERISDLKIPQLRPPSNSDILFHVNDPATTTSFKGDSCRSPDVNILPLKSAMRVHQTVDRSDLQEKCLKRPLEDRLFKWPDLCGTVDIKRLSSFNPEFPATYDTLLRRPIAPLKITNVPEVFSASSLSPSSSEPDSNWAQGVGGPSNPTLATNATVSGSRLSSALTSPSSNDGGERQRDQADMEPVDQSKVKKTNRSRDNRETREVITQCRLYAAEMLNCSVGRRHAITLTIVDEVVWVWWHDRQGAIQSSGIDIIKDLPRFLVLLLVFQRFTPADWGFDTELNPLVVQPRPDPDPAPTNPVQATPRSETINVRFGSGLDVAINSQDALHHTYSLLGRGTRVHGAMMYQPDAKELPVVAKMYWPEKRRMHEGDIIDQARGDDKALSSHLPKVFAPRDGYDTGVIRKQLNINEGSMRYPRVFRMIIFERLCPITELQGEAFINAWIHCIRSHHLIWPRVEHRDLSLKNLMYRKRGSEVFGVINDWDLSFAVDKSPSVTDFRATVPFLALELLRDRNPPEGIRAQYRHDLESFMWIAIWVFLSVDNGEDRPPPELRKWQTSDFGLVYTEKSAFIGVHGFDVSPLETWKKQWEIAKPLMLWFRDYYNNRTRDCASPEEPRLEQLVSFLNLVEKNLAAGHQLPTTPAIPGLDKAH